MKHQFGMKEIWIPDDADMDEDEKKYAKANIFMSPDFLNNEDESMQRNEKALILIQGTGAVRAG